VADANDYHKKRGNTAWAELTTEQKEICLRKATDYMVEVYRLNWAGVRAEDTQALDWPRYLVPRLDAEALYSYYAEDEVPREVENACAELALRAISGDLAPDLDRLTKRERLDKIEVEYDTVNGFAYKKYRAIDNMLRPLMKQGAMNSNTVELSRA
jgi:hypothetical protein